MNNVISMAHELMGAVVAVIGFVGSVCSIAGFADDRIAEFRLRRRKKMK